MVAKREPTVLSESQINWAAFRLIRTDHWVEFDGCAD